MIELRNFILKILQISNDYYEPDLDFIKLKYQLNSIKEFNSLYIKKSNELLIFNSNQSEKLFIRLVNLDENFINRKYNKDINGVIIDFIVNKNTNYFFSICDEFYNLNKSNIDTNIFICLIKSHIKNCNCKIRVKSIVNLSINTLIKIIKNTINNKKNLINNNVKNLKKKIKNSKNNMDIVDCIKILNTIKSNIGLECIDVDNNYIFEKTNNNILEKTNNNNILEKTNNNIFEKTNNNILEKSISENNLFHNKPLKNYKEKNNFNLKNQFDDTEVIFTSQLNKNNNNFQIDTENYIEDYKELNELIKKKIKKNNISYSLLSSINKSDSDKIILNINDKDDINKDDINKDDKDDKDDINKDNINKDDKYNNDDNNYINNEELLFNIDDNNRDSDKDELLFKLDELKDYFNSINENNIGQLLYGFKILYNIINNYKNNIIFTDAINIILNKIYKEISFSRDTFILDINDLIKMLL
jgi:hypothetical protein